MAMNRLDRQLNLSALLEPLSVSEFRREFLGKKAIHIKGDPDRFASLFGWSQFNRLLNSAPAPHPSSRLFKDRAKSPVSRDALDVIRHAQDGATIIVEDADRHDDTLGRFLDALSDEIGEPTRTNIYASSPDHQGFPLHYDTHDFLILQVEGFKKWRVFPSTIPSPLFFQKSHGLAPPDETELYLECALAQGDVLYVPRGHWHEALAEREASLHLTLALFWRTGIDFMSWLVDELREDEVLRQSFPLVLKDEASPDGGIHTAYYDHFMKVRDAILGTLDHTKELLDGFVTHNIAAQKSRCPFAFPFHMPDENVRVLLGFEFERPERISRLVRHDDTESVDLVSAGKVVIRFLKSALPALQFIFSRITFTGGELADHVRGLGHDDLTDILAALTKEGLIIPRRPVAQPGKE